MPRQRLRARPPRPLRQRRRGCGGLEVRLGRSRPPPRRSCRRSGRSSAPIGTCPERASIRPRATSSPRVMPPKMLTRMAFTFGSARMRRIASATLSARAPPPMSRKLAGSPPARLTRSIVVMARPAPLTMQPIVPSSLMKLMPAFRASRSVGSSSSRSRMRSSPGWRGRAESSSVTFASRQTSRSTAAPPAPARARSPGG